jgi:TonB family protein
VQATKPVQDVQPVQENRPVENAQPVQDTVPVQTAQPIQHTVQQQIESATKPIQDEVRPSPQVTQTVTKTEAPIESTDTVEQQTVPTQPVVTAALSPTVSTTERTVVEDLHAPIDTPRTIEQTVSARTAPEIQQRATVQHMAVRSRPATRPDYGWLSQALWSSVEQRKRYPQEARRNHWEGKVILRLKIEQRGAAIHLLDVALEESSGHTVLDRHTLEMVRKAFPLNVKHALAEKKIELHLPFSYRME